MDNLISIWYNLTSCYAQDNRLIAELWSEIEQNYTETGRHYHNLSHLEYMMGKAFQYNDGLEDPDIVLYSIFYHDIVYDPLGEDNEAKSANLAGKILSMLNVPSHRIIKCKRQILATKEHKSSEDRDTNFLMDFDLAILGDSPENYKDYTKKIRKEYSIYPDPVYRRGRKKVLHHFLNMERIFKTAPFYEDYEKQARKNLKAELEEM